MSDIIEYLHMIGCAAVGLAVVQLAFFVVFLIHLVFKEDEK